MRKWSTSSRPQERSIPSKTDKSRSTRRWI